jgi:zinc/manganese transport system permease protein
MIDFELSLLLPALCAGILVILTHAPLGQEVLKRGIIFIDLAIAQIAGLGVIIAHQLHLDETPWAIQLCAVVAALSGAYFLRLTERFWPDIQEALIGVSFVLAATLGIILLSNDPHAGEAIKELLVGQILWVDWPQLIPVAALYSLILIAWFAFPRLKEGIGFYIIFAITITQSVQLVGVYLVFACLIIPAIACQKLKKYKLLSAYALGIVSFALGLLISHWQDLPAGAVVVWMLAIVATAVSSIYSLIRQKIPLHTPK